MGNKSIFGCYILINSISPSPHRNTKWDGRLYIGADKDIAVDNCGRTGLGDACCDDAETTPVANNLTTPTTSWQRWYGADCMNQTNNSTTTKDQTTTITNQ